ncbi:MAG: 50S ribosomal protein L4 [Bacteroidales bacterium]|jgi:large subunit ribosomal protein L4|nr:50S ribosomal protein L4 [Bacteroidales bacterium]MCK9449192.1 50S ribosomal protein L4 [Bacteroidales bacterium]MDD3701770.1 50S ribosomal protein L4 [Bacteroidales bacterium]MDY0370151.1 50S ribosomal protein L4 [Bacteroidales bacterium]
MELVVHKITGEPTEKKIQLSEEIFGVEPNDHAIYLDVKQYLANNRQGTHKTKERNEIRGSNRKIKRQKGTGTARAGSKKSPIFIGGGRVFGPRPRDYSFKLNKKVKRLARRSALSYKAQGQHIIVLEDFNFEAPKTKKFIEFLNAFQAGNSKNLLVMNGVDKNVVLSARNIQRAKVVTAATLNTYDVMNANKLFFVESSLDTIQSILG